MADIIIKKRGFISKRFQGLGFIFVNDGPTALYDRTAYVDIAFLWARFWITFNWNIKR